MKMPLNTKDFWVDKFNSNLLEREDLEQEAWVVFFECQNKYKCEKSTFPTFFSNVLKNRFINMYNKRFREVETVQIILDDPIMTEEEDSYQTISDITPSTSWSPDQFLEWNCLIEEIQHSLGGLSEKLFDLELNPDLDFLDSCKKGSISNATMTDKGKYFCVSRNLIRKREEVVKKTVLKILKEGEENG